MEHTATPWELRRGQFDKPTLYGAGHRVVEFPYWLGSEDAAEVDANAEFTHRACNVHDELLAACEAQHEAIDRLFAMLIGRSPIDGEAFYPSKSGQPWDALVQGNQAIVKARGR